jgi:long-subunit fatty acid transport protein
MEKKLNDTWSMKLGYFYRPSPIKKGSIDEAGNSIDVDKHVTSIGAAYHFKFMEKILTLDLAYQGHFLMNQKVVKTPNREDGNTSEQKIGSPGYRIGGMIHTLGLGLSWAI